MTSKAISEEQNLKYLNQKPLNVNEAFTCINLICDELKEPNLT